MESKKIKFFIEPGSYIFSGNIKEIKEIKTKNRPNMESITVILDAIVPCKGWDLATIDKNFRSNNEIKAIIYDKRINKNSTQYDRAFFRFKDIFAEGPKKIILYRYILTVEQKEHFDSFPKVQDRFKSTFTKQDLVDVLQELKIEDTEEVTVSLAKVEEHPIDGPSWSPHGFVKKSIFKILSFFATNTPKPVINLMKRML